MKTSFITSRLLRYQLCNQSIVNQFNISNYKPIVNSDFLLIAQRYNQNRNKSGLNWTRDFTDFNVKANILCDSKSFKYLLYTWTS